MKKIFVLLFLSILLVSCVAPTSTPTINPAGNTRPAITDPFQPMEVLAGETFNIVIDSNPSTGYLTGKLLVNLTALNLSLLSTQPMNLSLPVLVV